MDDEQKMEMELAEWRAEFTEILRVYVDFKKPMESYMLLDQILLTVSECLLEAQEPKFLLLAKLSESEDSNPFAPTRH